jgi:hypothetical protein
MYLQLYQIKKHLNIDDDFKDDDEYLMDLGYAAELSVQKSIDKNLSELEDGDGMIPSPLIRAALFLVGTWYADRESVTHASATPLPHAYEFLANMYRDYYNTQPTNNH